MSRSGFRTPTPRIYKQTVLSSVYVRTTGVVYDTTKTELSV